MYMLPDFHLGKSEHQNLARIIIKFGISPLRFALSKIILEAVLPTAVVSHPCYARMGHPRSA